MDAEKGGCRLRYNSTDLNFFRVFTLFTPDLQLSDAVRAIRPPKLWIFDMDDTLYCASAGMFDAIHAAMRHFVADRLGVTVAEGQRLQEHYWSEYGATFLGLAKHHGILPEEFLPATHSFPVPPLVKTRADKNQLRRWLQQLPGKKVVLTNGPRHYAHQVLETLHCRDLFAGVLTSEDMHLLGCWRCKPDTALLYAAARLGGAVPRDCVLVEDSLRNLRSAKKLGMQTVWCIGNAGRNRAVERPFYVDSVIRTLKDLPHLTARKPAAPVVRLIDGRYH